MRGNLYKARSVFGSDNLSWVVISASSLVYITEYISLISGELDLQATYGGHMFSPTLAHKDWIYRSELNQFVFFLFFSFFIKSMPKEEQSSSGAHYFSHNILMAAQWKTLLHDLSPIWNDNLVLSIIAALFPPCSSWSIHGLEDIDGNLSPSDPALVRLFIYQLFFPPPHSATHQLRLVPSLEIAPFLKTIRLLFYNLGFFRTPFISLQPLWIC